MVVDVADDDGEVCVSFWIINLLELGEISFKISFLKRVCLFVCLFIIFLFFFICLFVCLSSQGMNNTVEDLGICTGSLSFNSGVCFKRTVK